MTNDEELLKALAEVSESERYSTSKEEKLYTSKDVNEMLVEYTENMKEMIDLRIAEGKAKEGPSSVSHTFGVSDTLPRTRPIVHPSPILPLIIPLPTLHGTILKHFHKNPFNVFKVPPGL